MTGSTALIHTIGARRLTLRTSHQSSIVTSTNAPSWAIPALLTRSDGGPSVSTVRPATRAASASSRTSPTTVSQSTPYVLTDSAVASRSSWERATNMSAAPASARSIANARPRPLLAPVTMPTLPASGRSTQVTFQTSVAPPTVFAVDDRQCRRPRLRDQHRQRSTDRARDGASSCQTA